MQIYERGRLIEATYVRHLRTITPRHTALGNSNIDVDLFRTGDGRLVVARSPENDARATPVVDESDTPDNYGVE